MFNMVNFSFNKHVDSDGDSSSCCRGNKDNNILVADKLWYSKYGNNDNNSRVIIVVMRMLAM